MNLLQVSGLDKRFGGLHAVKNLSFTVGEREIVGLIGPNGAGKTTVFGLLSGFLRPDAGQVIFRGRSITGLPPHRVNALGLARTFQIVRPFPHLPVLRNVTVGAMARHAARAAATQGALAVLDELGLPAKRDQPAASLTLAERKRLELARALATEPTLLLLDEVMAGLNATETERIVDLVGAINRRGVAVRLNEHRMRAVVSRSQRIVLLNPGELIARGRPDGAGYRPRRLRGH